MKPDEIKHLLGAYATGTLTPEEQKALFDAALDDQDLFDALAREQPLKEALESPAVRRELIEALESKPSWRDRFSAWLRWPYPLAGAVALAAAALTVVVIVRLNPPAERMAAPAAQVAEVRAPLPEQPAQSAAQPQKPAGKPRKTVTPMDSARRAEPAQPVETAEVPRVPAPAALETPAPAAAPPPPAGPERKAEQALAAADSVRPEPNVAQVRTAPAAPSAAGGVVGGVVGGYPANAPRSMAALPRAAKVVTESTVAPLGLRYSVREPRDEPAQLTVESTVDAVLYIFRRDDTGVWLPVAAGGISLKARAPATTPGIVISGLAPEPRALLILSRTPVTDLAQNGPALSAAVDRLRAENTATPLLTDTSGFLVTPRRAALIVTPLALP